LSFFFAAETPAKKKIMPFGSRFAICEIFTLSVLSLFCPLSRKGKKSFSAYSAPLR
jgi:hypothetical protein